MARNRKTDLNRSLDLLSHSVALTLQLGGLADTSDGRVGVLRERLQRAQAELDAHRKRQPLDKRLTQRKADTVFAMLVEYLTAVAVGSNKRT